MNKFSFALMNDEDGSEKLICAMENSEGKGSLIGLPKRDFESMNTQKKVDTLNEMMIALLRADEVKKGIDFKNYVRH